MWFSRDAEVLVSEVNNLAEDLHFVRQAVDRRGTSEAPPSVLYLWAIYVIVGYALIDFAPRFAGPFFAIGGIVGGLLSWWIGRSHSRRMGESNRAEGIRALLHFGGGIVLSFIFIMALALADASLRGARGSQAFVIMIGLVYFLWGVHEERYYLLLGVVVMVGGVLVGYISHFGWTILGAVISLGLILPTLVPVRRPPAALAV
jgi:uncharacterized Tic20 family protein